MLTEGTFKTGELYVHYGQCTNGAANAAPLTLLHGITYSECYWAPIAEAIGAKRQVFMLDLRGRGLSGQVTGGYRFTDYPRDQIAFMREVVRAPAVLIGHSLDAINAVYIAAEMPERGRAIVLEDPPRCTLPSRA